MKIAYLGWGSLIWNPRKLATSGLWQKDGPRLPIEFAHVSEDKRLTLVLYSSGANVPTLWILSSCTALPKAIDSLREREGTTKENIGYQIVSSGRGQCRTGPDVLKRIRDWGRAKEIDAVVWTDLKADFEEKTKRFFDGDTVIEYLKNLPPPARLRAEEYVRKAPKQIRTPLRTKIENELGWKPCFANPLKILKKEKAWPANWKDEIVMRTSHGRTETLMYKIETDNGTPFWYQVPVSGDVIAIVAHDRDRNVYLIRQARPAWAEKTSGVLVLPGGGVAADLDDNGRLREAKRELKEETGFDCRTIQKLATVLCSARIRSKHHIYMAEIKANGEPEPEEMERILEMRLEVSGLEETIEKFQNGEEETTGYTILGLLLALEKLMKK